MKKVRKILGVDPGTNALGFAFIQIIDKRIVLDSMGIIRLDKYENAYVKLQQIHERMKSLIARYQPEEMGIEAPFFGKNVQSMLKLGRAQGVVIATAMSAGVTVEEYSPKSIKKAITGNGNASKEQVAAMSLRMLKTERVPKYFDSTDALGAALCHYINTSRKLSSKDGKVYKDWKSFAEQNKGKLK